MGTELELEHIAKDLGVILDTNLTDDEHISKTFPSWWNEPHKEHFNKCTLISIINASVFIKLFYCSNVWTNTSKRIVNKLQSIQNFDARIVPRMCNYDHITPVLKELN